jgi:predicted DNA-binding transcriptional regulator YafY
VRYYLATHTFEFAELCLLIDAIQSSKFLTTKKSKELIRKLEGLGSRYEATRLHKQVYFENRLKTENEEIYRTIATLHSAIAANRMIGCKYFEWNSYKQRLLRRGGDEYRISPWALIWEDEYYYLVAYDSDAGKIKHFRVDKMLQVHVLDAPREGETLFSEIDMALYSQRVFGMYGGEQMYVRISADPSLAGVIFDRFGTELTVLNHHDRFEFAVKVMVSPTFFAWVLGFGGRMKILSPDFVAEQAASIAKEVVALYDNDSKT